MTTQTEALKALVHEMEYVLSCINAQKVPFDGDDFHEALRLGKEALSQTENDKERCVGCKACIDTACGRDECPKGWPKAAQPEQEPVAWVVEDKHGERIEWACDAHSCYGLPTIPLYTTPPQRTWVGLDEEDDIDWEEGGSLRDLVEAVEAKLKEKNT